MKRFIQFFVMTLALLAMSQTAGAQTFTIEASHNNSTNKTTFTITRSGSSLPQQTINYRTVNLSAYAGQHYTAVSGSYTFPANETTKTVEVAESSPGTDAYKYQTTTQRSYRFEVLDVNGFELAHNDRTYTTGAQFSSAKVSKSVTNLVTMTSSGNFSSGMSSSKYLDVSFTPPSGYVEANNNNGLEGYVLIDDSYDYATKPAYVSTSSLINSTNASYSYLQSIGYKIYATVCFTEKERDDGYQYVQIVAGNTAHSYDGRDGDGKIDNGPTNSVYKACFELADGSNSTGKAYFPHRGTGTDEFSLSTGKLHQQKFNSSSYNGSGSVVLDPNVSYITTRFDAAGDNDDTWGYKDFFVRMALCDATYPTLLSTNAITVSTGPYVKGNTFYISVPFSEIVHISGAFKQLETTWGNVTYESGDNTNVITFKGTITANAGTVLAITSINNSLFNDLAGNYYQGSDDSFDKTFRGVSCTDTYTLAATNTEFTGLADEYAVSNAAIEPHPTIYFYKGIVNTTNRVTLAETTDYTLAWANNTAPGTGTVTASGTGSYTGSISTTFPIRWATYTVHFDKNHDGATGTGEMSDIPFTYATAQNLTANAFTRTGYDFAGWNTAADGSGDSYTDGQEVNNLTPVDGATVTLYAQWTAHTYTVHFDKNHNDATGTGTMNDQPFTYDTAQNLTANAFTRTGYTFAGWSITPEGDVAYTDGQEVNNLTPVDGATVTLYAQWTVHTYTVHFHSNDGTGTMNDMTFTYDEAQNLTANAFTRTGCIFDGWNTAADGSGDSYTDGQEVSNLTAEDGATVILYAQWNDLWDVKNGADGSNARPYLITTPAGLVKLADDVNGGTDYFVKYFKLGNDIDMSGVTFNGIGNGQKYFAGYFDGDNKSISNLTINSTNNYKGLFGWIAASGDVKNIILDGAVISGKSKVGGIVGYTSGKISNCLVINSSIYTEGTYAGVIAGQYSHNNLTANYYHNCSITQGGTTSTTNIGANSSDRDGARSVHSLTLDDGVTATGESITISGTTYYASNTTVTLGFTYTANTPEGYAFDGFDVKDADDNDVTVTESDGTYAFTMPASDATASITFADVWGIAGGADGSEAHPYIITTTAGLDLLATRVNSRIEGFGNEYGGKYFKLGADIAYTYTTDWDDDTSTENNYTAIGNYSKAFCGIFDGDGHTVSGIRIYQPNTEYQGLFGRVWAGTVKNVILTDTRINGWGDVGGITGQINGGATIQNCLVLNTAIQSRTDYYAGVVIGEDEDGALLNNHYHGCTVNGTADAVNVGAQGKDRVGARSVHTLTLGSDISASTTATLTYNHTDYYAVGTPVTLNYEGTVPEGKTAVFTVTSSNGDVVQTFNTFEMPAANVTVSVTMGEPYTLTLPDDVSATGMTTTIGDNEYFLSGTIVTLTYTGTLDIGQSPVYSLNGTPIEGNTFEMPAQDVTVSVNFTDQWGIADGANGSKTNPYVITTPEGLQLLSTYTDNNNNSTLGMYFQLGADIDMSGVSNFTPIGWNNSFEGSFDGAGHTISHLTIDRGNDVIGLFGYINGGSVNNLTLDGATITGDDAVGGIAGCSYFASITNCHVINSVIRGSEDVGAIGGYLYEGSDSGNTYHSTLVYGDTDYGYYHGGGDAFNIGVGNYYFNSNNYGDVEGWFELDATKLFLGDGQDNSDLIAAYADPESHTYDDDYYAPDLSNLEVTLQGRTLWKDNGWNTLCLPFNLENFAGTPLEGATVKTLESSSFENGTLTLNFETATSIVAGQPYIVKWESGDHLVNPVFSNLSITNTLTDIQTDIIDFVGTYAPVDFGTEENRSVLLMGATNNLFYPNGQSSSYVNAFRGYFRLHDGYTCGDPANGNDIKGFIINFDDEATGITGNADVSSAPFTADGDVRAPVYDLQGRRVAQPTKGIYIVNGKKVYIK